jgi:hypothetical protein
VQLRRRVRDRVFIDQFEVTPRNAKFALWLWPDNALGRQFGRRLKIQQQLYEPAGADLRSVPAER